MCVELLFQYSQFHNFTSFVSNKVASYNHEIMSGSSSREKMTPEDLVEKTTNDSSISCTQQSAQLPQSAQLQQTAQLQQSQSSSPSFPSELSQFFPSPPVGCQTFKHSPDMASTGYTPTFGPQRHLSAGLRKIWNVDFKGNPFGYSLMKYRVEFPDDECLVWLNSEVRIR